MGQNTAEECVLSFLLGLFIELFLLERTMADVCAIKTSTGSEAGTQPFGAFITKDFNC